MAVNISDIIWDQFIANENETTEATIILDDVHRSPAFKEKGIKKIAAVEWKEKPLDYGKNKTALLLDSAGCNISHGDRLSPGDKKRIARDIASTDLECTWTEDALAEKLGVITSVTSVLGTTGHVHEGPGESSNTTTLLRPLSLALYNAASALAIKSSGVASSPGTKVETPKLTVT